MIILCFLNQRRIIPIMLNIVKLQYIAIYDHTYMAMYGHYVKWGAGLGAGGPWGAMHPAVYPPNKTRIMKIITKPYKPSSKLAPINAM